MGTGVSRKEDGGVTSQSSNWSRAVLDVLEEALAVLRIVRGDDGEVREILLDEYNAAAGKVVRRDGSPHRARELCGCELDDLGLGRLNAPLRSLLITVADSGTALQRRISVSRDDTEWWEITVHPVDGQRVCLLGRDVSEMVRQERLLESAYDNAAGVRATLQTALDATSDCFAVYDVQYDSDLAPTELHLVMINPAGAGAFGVPEELIGMELREFYPRVVETGLWDAIHAAVRDQIPATYRLHEHDEDGKWVSSWDNTIAPVSADQVVVTWRDVTEEEQRQRQLADAHVQAQHAAQHDDLTGLANRVLLEERLERTLREMGAEERTAVAFCDLDGFKTINDTLGHQVGDEVLCAVAERLKSAVRTDDTVARVGGDEFVLLLRNLPPEWDNSSFVARIRGFVEERLEIPGLSGVPRLSIGVSVSPPEQRDAERLLRLSDERMYEDKVRRHAGRERTAFPDPSGSGIDTGSKGGSGK
jgi:diguanylate cyclase (GGDEF)-like protein